MDRQLFRLEKNRLALGVVALLLLLAVLGLTTDLFRSPRSIVRDAVQEAFEDQQRKVDLSFTIEPSEDQPNAQRLSVQATGIVANAANAHLQASGTSSVRIRQKGVELVYDMDLRAVNGATYLKFNELPVIGGAGEKLEGIWLRLSDPKEGELKELSSQDRAAFLRTLFGGNVVEHIEAEGKETIEGMSGRVYRVRLRRDVARDLLKQVAEQEGPAALRGTAGWTANMLEQFDIDTLLLTITPRTHDLLRVQLVLVPLQENLKGSRLVGTATLLPAPETSGATEVPENSQKLSRPELILGLFGFRL